MIYIDREREYLAGILPCNAGDGLNGESTKRSQHSPPPMNELALPKPLQPKNLAVRLERSRLHIRTLEPGSDHITGNILGQVLVQGVQIKLQILRRFPQSEGVKPIVSHQTSVKILRCFCSWVP
ncbi:hypothetical protein Hanom_Chr15g01338521 [Helianthus anomalus]